MPCRWLAHSLALLAAMLATSGCRQGQAGPKAGAAKEPVRLSIAPVESRPMEKTVTALGSLLPMGRATVSIKTTGRLKLLNVDVGSPVRTGDVLAQVEPRDYELRLQQSAAFLAQARARLGLPFDGTNDVVEIEKVSVVREAAALFEEAGKTLERVRQLKSEKVISQSELERATAEHQVTLNRYQDALQDVRERQAVLAQRRAEHEIARQQVADTSLRAPFDGVVQARLTNVGEFLAAGSPVLSLVQVDPLRLRMEIPERQASMIHERQVVRATLEGGTNVHTGTIARVSPALDDRSRMLTVEAEFRNPGQLRPGSFARADIVVEEALPAVVIPLDALVTFAGMEKAFRVVNGAAKETRVLSGRREGQWIEILQGLKPGDVVILNPGGLQTGDRAQPTNGIPPSVQAQAAADPDHAKAR